MGAMIESTAIRRCPSMFVRSTVMAVVAALSFAVCARGEDSPGDSPGGEFRYSFRNPYYTATSWTVRLTPESPAGEARLPRLQDLYHAHEPDPAKPQLYMDYRRARAANRYAGFWDDVYVSQDNNHSFMIDRWAGRDGNSITGITSSMVTATSTDAVIRPWGVNFTSQSTTGMGHGIANVAGAVVFTEREFYFANCLRSGPAHVSYLDNQPAGSVDEYQALLPSMYNSMGSSGGEVAALGKLVLAGGYLPREVKRNMKRAGIYPASLLYIWKAALPYEVPYDHELRHRVAYFSTGDHSDYTGVNQTEYNVHYHAYDDDLHMRNMIRIARSMTTPTPVAILKKVSITGGTVVNDTAKTSWLVRQQTGQPVAIVVSPKDSYDVYGRPLTYRMTMIHGDPGTVITQHAETGDFIVVVPGTARLPRGRTTVLLIANNGTFDSNPAAINIFRTSGENNRRPVMTWPAAATLLPGETFAGNISAKDPEGFPVRISRRANEVGTLAGNRFEWKVPQSQPDGAVRAHFIASDGTAGNSYESREVVIDVRSTVAELKASATQDKAPLTVRFSAGGSRDKTGGALTYAWDFDDGSTAATADPSHVFAGPGYYRVQLTVTGASGSHTVSTLVHAAHDWKTRLRDGWNERSLDERVWERIDPRTPAAPVWNNGKLALGSFDGGLPTGSYGLSSTAEFSSPLYFEAEFLRAQTETPGAGFQVLDAVIGFTAASGNTMRNEYIAAPDGKGGWTGTYVADRVRDGWMNTLIRLYVTPDPNHAGRYRYQGVLSNERGTALIRLDDQPRPTGRRIKMINSEPRSRIELFGVKVNSP